jgi:hypothetical protein
MTRRAFRKLVYSVRSTTKNAPRCPGLHPVVPRHRVKRELSAARHPLICVERELLGSTRQDIRSIEGTPPGANGAGFWTNGKALGVELPVCHKLITR